MKNIYINPYKMYLLLFTMLMMNLTIIIYNYKIMFILLMILFMSNKNINPLFINVFIILLTICIALKINYMSSNNWFSMMMFLVMIGGMMIIFLYFNSFMINEEFMVIKSNFFFNNLLKISIFSIINIIVFMKIFKMLMISINLKIMNDFTKYIINESILMMIINNKIDTSLIVMIIYLLYSLIVITYLCSNKNMSLRKII
uniref:NADH dehydrogenase subunit 6 n=1 Tax=Ceratobaeus sp. MM-2013 TaxID=1429432 RepID=A0A067YF94_9HYME|nr:NADH dehydrogenase subunit 6 [Ceratobaeus sp. MM-2013]